MNWRNTRTKNERKYVEFNMGERKFGIPISHRLVHRFITCDIKISAKIARCTVRKFLCLEVLFNYQNEA